MKFAGILLIMTLLAACTSNPKDKIIDYLRSVKVDTQDASVIILNPDYCGSCTEEVVNWLIRYDASKDSRVKYILKTAEIPEHFAKKLQGTHYKQILVKGEKIDRLGYGGAISTHILVKDDEIVTERLIKELP